MTPQELVKELAVRIPKLSQKNLNEVYAIVNSRLSTQKYENDYTKPKKWEDV